MEARSLLTLLDWLTSKTPGSWQLYLPSSGISGYTQLSMHVGDLNSGPQACMADTLLMSHFPSPIKHVLRDNVCGYTSKRLGT